MPRLFEVSTKRRSECLDGFWRFQTDPQDRGECEGWYNGLPAGETCAVPSVWNCDLSLLQYEGAAFYQRELYTDGGTLRFCFEGVMTDATVWLDDMLIGSHCGGFCEFDCIVSHVAAGHHRLTVRADNRFHKTSIPQKNVDWYHYGGITRHVRVEQLHGVCVLNDQLHYDLELAVRRAHCHFVLELYNAEDHPVTAPLTACVGDRTVVEATVSLGAGERIEWRSPTFVLEDLRLWDVSDPYLYKIEISTQTDSLCDRTGFRTVEVCEGALLLNGRPIELRGVNRHEEHPDFGMAFPEALMKRDLDIIGDLGCNTVRGSHYPNAQSFVDMLDARGLLFWSEIPIWGWGFSLEALSDPAVIAHGLEMHREMVKYYFNHPSVIIWGMHNEIHTESPASLEMSKLYYTYLKQNGGGRIVTYATDKISKGDLCLSYCDVVSINAYHGWYSGNVESWGGFLQEIRDRLAEANVAHKPVIISEFGAAALYGQHTFDHIPWTEEYQADLLASCIELFHADPTVVGYYIWQFCDIRTCPQMGLNRARGFNNKGILNEHRKPKAAYHAVKALYRCFAKEE